eukprot:TRINITY_DN8852_c0_g2_i5.p1 TRINITY_DN8852_c0_g2~~TRINITY_DN8852_c0_g2_i5.p1  ORF type:complete len:879 (+),score=217.84 TRINITY_DN8852_c0_g2_i5:62-2698(+)
MIRRPPRSTLSSSSAASDVYKRQRMSEEDLQRFNAELVEVEQREVSTAQRLQIMEAVRSALGSLNMEVASRGDVLAVTAEILGEWVHKVHDVDTLVRSAILECRQPMCCLRQHTLTPYIVKSTNMQACNATGCDNNTGNCANHRHRRRADDAHDLLRSGPAGAHLVVQSSGLQPGSIMFVCKLCQFHICVDCVSDELPAEHAARALEGRRSMQRELPELSTMQPVHVSDPCDSFGMQRRNQLHEQVSFEMSAPDNDDWRLRQAHQQKVQEEVTRRIQAEWHSLGPAEKAPFESQRDQELEQRRMQVERLAVKEAAKLEERREWSIKWVEPDEELVKRQAVCLIKGALTSKIDWRAKVHDGKIVTKWQNEACGQGASEEGFAAAIKELRADKYFNRHGLAYTDDLASEELRSGVRNALDLIADAPDKDFHPNSNERVQNLIHPSLYALALDSPKSGPKQHRGLLSSSVGSYSEAEAVIEENGDDAFCDDETGERVWVPPPMPADPLWHCVLNTGTLSSFQWLPSEVDVDSAGNAKFASYINNMPPAHADALTPLLEECLTLAIPNWEQVLAHPDGSQAYCLKGRRLQVIVKAANYSLEPEQTHEGSWHVEGMPVENIVATGIYYYHTTDNMKGGNLSFRRMRNLNIGSLNYEGNSVSLGYNEYAERLPSINAAADDDDVYVDGWKPEEDPEALGHNQYDQGNGYNQVPTGHPRHRFHFTAEAGEKESSKNVYEVRGTDHQTPNNVPVDCVPTEQDRWVFFKNSLQHKVNRLYNTSQTEKAERKILLFWLVNPALPITSTAEIAPQQFDDVIMPVIVELFEPLVGHSAAEKIAEHARWGLTPEDAKANRLSLMAERSHGKVDKQFETQILTTFEFNFCEH